MTAAFQIAVDRLAVTNRDWSALFGRLSCALTSSAITRTRVPDSSGSKANLMTMVVGFNLGEYILIGADSRVSWYPNDRLVFRDDHSKIRHTSMGLISGAGLIDFLDPVKQRLADEEVEHTDRIREIILEERARLDDWEWRHDRRVSKAIEGTAWMLTYVRPDDVEKPTVQGLTLRLGVTVPDQDYRFALCPVNDVLIIPPSEVSTGEPSEWREFCANRLEPYAGAPYSGASTEFIENVTHHVGVIAAIMQIVSEANEAVAPSFQIGVHTRWLDSGISNVISEPDYQCAIEWRRPGMPNGDPSA